VAGRAAYLKRLTLSGIGGATITTNRNVTFPIQINDIQVKITALILPKHCSFMPRVIVGLSDLIHKLGGVGFMPSDDKYGESRVIVRFPKLGTSVESERFLKHPDELAPLRSDMDPEGWNLIAMAAIHQGVEECAVRNCRACNYQPVATTSNGAEQESGNTEPIFFAEIEAR